MHLNAENTRVEWNVATCIFLATHVTSLTDDQFPTLNEITDVEVTEDCHDEKKSPLNGKQLKLKCRTTITRISLKHSDFFFQFLLEFSVLTSSDF